MKKIMILGAGNAQIDAIEYCKEKGYEVYGCSYTNTDKGIPYLDHFIQLDIKDADGIAEYVKENNIDAVYSVGSDLAMPTVMKVCEMLNMPHFISYETAKFCQTKNELISFLGQDFEGNIPFIIAEKIEDAFEYKSFPAMMKPVDSQGQRGCYRVNGREDIEKHFEDSLSFSKSGRVIIEKYIDGPEVSVNAYVQNGEVKFMLVSDRKVFEDLPGGIIKEHILPSVSTTDEGKKNVYDLVKRTLAKLSILNGPVYFQIKMDGDFPVIIEVTPRLDGCHMWNLINNYCGFNLLEASFEHLLGNVQIEASAEPKHDNLKLAFYCEKPGTVFDSEKHQPKENALYSCKYYETGDTVKSLNGYMEKCGYQIYEEIK